MMRSEGRKRLLIRCVEMALPSKCRGASAKTSGECLPLDEQVGGGGGDHISDGGEEGKKTAACVRD